MNNFQIVFNDSSVCTFLSSLLQRCMHVYFEQLYVIIVLTAKQWNYGYIVCEWSKVMFLWYFIINEFVETMLLQMQGFFKDMNAICKVLNIGQPVLQIMTV